MEKENQRKTKVGLIVIIGTIFLIIAIYSIGRKQNLFGNSFRVYAEFRMVNGLTAGNNVRFAGIDVGTVDKIEIVSDTTVKVYMLIDEKIRQHIRQSSVASIGTDGLMGNKLVNISSHDGSGPIVENGDRITSEDAFKTEEMMATLNTTNDNLNAITADIRMIASKINGPNSLWSILLDTTVAENFKQSVVNIRLTSAQAARLSSDLSAIVQDVRKGKGPAGMLLTDTVLSSRLRDATYDMKEITATLSKVSEDLENVVNRANQGEGALGTILADSAFASNLAISMKNIREGTDNFNQNMEALKRSFLLRKYFRKKSAGDTGRYP